LGDNNTYFIELFENEARISHIIIAEQTNNLPKSILDLITKNISDFEYFGQVVFSDLKSLNRGRPQRTYFLNEQQATLLMTYLKNTEILKRFKVQLVQDFKISPIVANTNGTTVNDNKMAESNLKCDINSTKET